MPTNLCTILAELIVQRKFVDKSGIPSCLVHKTETRTLQMLRKAVLRYDKVEGTEDALAFDAYKDEIRDIFFWCMDNEQKMEERLWLKDLHACVFNVICDTMPSFPNIEKFQNMTNRQYWWLFLYRCMGAGLDARQLGFYLAEAVLYKKFILDSYTFLKRL